MAVTIQGVTTSQTTTVTLPSHQIGDLIVIFAYRSSTVTAPTKPAASGTVPAWADIDANTGANTNSSRTAYFVATANNHTSGTWTNATSMIAVVIRGQHGIVPIGNHAESGSAGTIMTAPSIQMGNSDGTSLLLHFFGASTGVSWGSPAAGYTMQATTATSGSAAALVTKNVTTSDGAVNQGAQSNTGYRGATIEILAPNTTNVLYSAIGSMSAVSLTGSSSWSYPANAGDTVIADIYADRNSIGSVTYGGAAMKKIGQISYAGGSGNGTLARYVIFNVAAGSATVAFSITGGSAWVFGASVGYQNAQSIDIAKIITGTGTTITQSAPVTTGQMAVQSVGGASFATSSQTGGTNRGATDGSASLAINDTNATDTFVKTLTTSKSWGAILSTLSTAAPLGVYYDSIGTGFSANGTSGSFNHTATAGAYVIVDICVDRTVTLTPPTYDGNTMTLLGTTNFPGASGTATLYRYGIANVAGGTKVVSFSVSASAWLAAGSISILGANAISASTPVGAGSSTPTQGASCQPGQLIVQSFGARSILGSITGGANLYDSQSNFSTVGISICDRPTTFNASVTGADWGGLVTVFGPSGSVFPPAPPYVISTAAASTSSVTLPTHQPGDLIVISTFNNASTTTLTKPAAGGTVPAWVDIDNNTGANSCSMRTVYFVATTSNHTSGTWTNANAIDAIVYRGVGAIPIGGHAESGGTGTGSVAPSITLSNGDGSSAILEIHASRTTSSFNAAPAGYTRRVSDASGYTVMNTKDDATSDGAVTQTGTSSTGYRGATIEIVGFNGPVYDTVGAGANTTSTSLSWTHAGAVGAYVFVAVELSNVASTVTVTSCTYGGTAMTQLGATRMNNDSTAAAGVTYLFGLANTPGGVKTVSVTLSASAKAMGNSVSYIGVTTVTPAQSVYGSGTSLSQAVTPSFGQRVVQVFGNYPASGSGTLTTSGGFNRYNGTANSGASNLSISDTIVPTTFSATPASSSSWSGIAVTMSIYNGAFFPLF